MNLPFKITIPLLACLFLIPSLLLSQDKKPLDHSVYDSWKSVGDKTISDDGRFISYTIEPQKGDGSLYLYDQQENEYHQFSRGSNPVFDAASQFLAYRIKPEYDTVRKMKLEKVKKEKLPKDSLGIFLIRSGKIYKFPGLKTFIVPRESGSWMAALLEPQEKTISDNDSITAQESGKKESRKKKGDDKDKDMGRLLLLHPVNGDSLLFEDVTAFTFDKNGHTAAFVSVRRDSIDSVRVMTFSAKDRTTRVIYDGPGVAVKPSLDEQGRQLAYLFSRDTAENKVYQLNYIDLTKDEVHEVSAGDLAGGSADWSASEHGKLAFNRKGTELYFGTAPKPEAEIKDTLTEDEKVSVDIWTWHDTYLQTQQLEELKDELKRNYTAVYFPGDGQGVQLANPGMKDADIDPRADGTYSLLFDRDRYGKLISWEASRYKDVWLVNRENGERKMILEKVASTVSLSPGQNFVAWYNLADSSWNVYDIRDNVSRKIDPDPGIHFYNEENDIPDEARPYGMAGWTENEKLIVYDRYDLWRFDPTGKKEPENLTSGMGRRNDLRLRYVKLDREETFLPEQLLLSAFNEKNKKAGYYSLDISDGEPEQLIFGDYYFREILKARKSDRVIWTKESFTLFPDLYASSLSFDEVSRITRANPQQESYIWGTTELVSWVNFDGDSLQGILVKPENFDPSRKYPMLVYFYERSSDRLNWYYVPKPIRSTVNWTYYASNGYLLFIPDIVYRKGYPGPSSFDCVVSGTNELCSRFSYIDRERLGIQGQSWGGYQTAYIITQTSMFKAAMAGAPVSNMTSAYGGIRWGTGLSRAFQYEESQSRIGATLWERRDLYLLNSPLFFADRVNTPLLIMHNDADGAVPWYQGIELFSALRRLDKPVWMLVYNKAPHNLKRRADMEDLTVRMQQFFDHFLKDAPEPLWMSEGIPAIEKGKETGFETE